MRQLKEQHGSKFQPDMPKVSEAYLLEYLFEVGPLVNGHSLTFQELTAWQERIGLNLSPWENSTLHRLSIDYLSQSHESEKRDCPAPWVPKNMSEENRAAVARQIEDSLRSKAKP